MQNTIDPARALLGWHRAHPTESPAAPRDGTTENHERSLGARIPRARSGRSLRPVAEIAAGLKRIAG